MYSVQLEKEQLNELNRLARNPATKPRTRQRLEMVRLRALASKAQALRRQAHAESASLFHYAA
jgi:hypothetical protein